MKVIVLTGLTGSGKTNLLKQMVLRSDNINIINIDII
jgi:G3E family GTPase